MVLVSQDPGSFIFIWLCPSPPSPGLFKVNKNRNNRRRYCPPGVPQWLPIAASFLKALPEKQAAFLNVPQGHGRRRALSVQNL